MKKILVLLFCLNAFIVKSQEYRIIPESSYQYEFIGKKINGKPCDTCKIDYQILASPLLTTIISGAGPANGSHAETGNLKEISKFRIIAKTFTLDLLPNGYSEGNHKTSIPNENIEVSVYQSGKMIKDWTGVMHLSYDSSIFFNSEYLKNTHENVKSLNNNPKLVGTYNLNIGDSVTALVRNKTNGKVIQNINIKRIELTPKVLGFFSFSEKEDLEEAMNFFAGKTDGRDKEMEEKFKPIGLQDKSKNEISLDDDKTGALVFDSDDIGIAEYRFADNTDVWQTLKTKAVLLRNPTPGKTIELHLRYKDQSETIRTIKIHVKEKLTSTTFFKVGASLGLAFLVFSIWYYFRKRQHKKQIKKLELQKAETENKLELLSGQLNPHFLFNSLNAVQSLILKKEYPAAENYAGEIALFLRTIMESGRKEYISLKEEISIEEKYIQLEQKRKPFRFELVNQSPVNLAEIEFPPLLLQPVIENNIIHGFVGEISNPMLTIVIESIQNNMLIAVKNNGKQFDAKQVPYGHGLLLVKKRIELLNQNTDGFHISMELKSEGKETSTTFTFKNWL